MWTGEAPRNAVVPAGEAFSAADVGAAEPFRWYPCVALLQHPVPEGPSASAAAAKAAAAAITAAASTGPTTAGAGCRDAPVAGAGAAASPHPTTAAIEELRAPRPRGCAGTAAAMAVTPPLTWKERRAKWQW